MEHKEDNQKFETLMIPVVIANGIVSGIISVITAYFFKPLWNKIISYINKNR